MTRISIPVHAPDGYRAVQALDAEVRAALDPVLVDLVYLRVSQLNGCAYCVDLHGRDLAEQGIPWRVISAVGVWRETAWFSPMERAALRVAEELTRLDPGAGPHGVSDEAWAEAAEYLSDAELANLVLAVGTMALFNRIGVATKLRPAGPVPERSAE